MPVLYHLAETCTGSDRGFHTFAVCLPETDIVQQLINVVVKSLFTFLSAPYLNTIFGEPFNDKRCFVGDSPNTVKHKDKQNIELLFTVISVSLTLSRPCLTWWIPGKSLSDPLWSFPT